jgi:hypothetical protein
MPRLIWANFDAEHELGGGPAEQPSRTLVAQRVRLARGLRFLAQPGDWIVVPALPKSDLLASLVSCDEVKKSDAFAGGDWSLVPWMVTESLCRLPRRRGWFWHHPDPAIVKDGNDRLTSFEWERRTQTLPEGAGVIESVDELKSAIAGGDGREWFVKARFGMSGRERILIRRRLGTNQIRWFEKRLARDQSVILEPRLDAVAEAGLQPPPPEP